MRRFISIVILSVYSIILAHSFIAHHHHMGFGVNIPHCEIEQQMDHSCKNDFQHNHEKHLVEASETCCVHHQHSEHAHNFCNFEEEIVLTKGINLSDLFLPSTEIKYFEPAQNRQSFTDAYFPLFIHDPHCRDVQLRGPPQFS